MKSMRKTKLSKLLICAIIILSFLSGLSVNAENSYFEQARVLYNLGLYMGTSPTYFEPDLSSFVDRETAIVFLLRLVGKKIGRAHV